MYRLWFSSQNIECLVLDRQETTTKNALNCLIEYYVNNNNNVLKKNSLQSTKYKELNILNSTM
jgi:hypothetical protein